MDLNTRLLRLVRAVANDKVETITQFLDQANFFLDERLSEWEEKLGLDADSKDTPQDQGAFSDQGDADRADTHHYQDDRQRAYPGYSKQVVEDLQVFGLVPPSSLHDVKQARNREMKKFHPDRFMNDQERAETAKKIVQIYNAAYDRLEKTLKEL